MNAEKIQDFATQQIETNTIFSVIQLSNLLKKHVELKFSNIRVKAEISGFKMHSSGHCYFTLKDQDAIIDAVMWRGTPISLKLEDGISIVATGRITTYPARSKYQMVVEKAEPEGEGELMKMLLERKAKFQSEGLFSKSNPIPKFPKVIGVITSPTGAVIQDIIHRIKDRYPCHILLWPVLVQGKGCEEQVAEAIKGFNSLEINKPDVLIIARGGGSFEDLWPFNDEQIIRAVFASTIPVVSAVGHETDTTLVDFAADLRAPTPTAAAELVTPVLSELIIHLSNLTQRLINAYSRLVQNYQMRYQLTLKSFIDPIKYIHEKSQRVDDWSERLNNLKKTIILIYGQRLSQIANKLSSPKMQTEINQEKLQNLSKRLQNSSFLILERANQRFEHIVFRLEQSSYQKTLEKGFCLISDMNGKTITSTKDFIEKEGTYIQLSLKDGKVETKISDMKKLF